MKNGCTLILDAFWVDNKDFPTEQSRSSPIGRILYDGYNGTARHLGWMDVTQLRQIIQKRNVSHIILKNLITLGRAAQINFGAQICTAYLYKHSFIIRTLPEKRRFWKYCEPLYHTYDIGGWDFSDDDDAIPLRAQNYMRHLLMLTKVNTITYTSNKITATAFFNDDGFAEVLIEPIMEIDQI